MININNDFPTTKILNSTVNRPVNPDYKYK